MHLWLASAQIHVSFATHVIPFNRGYMQLFFAVDREGNENLWKFPVDFRIAPPPPSVLQTKFSADLLLVGVDLARIPTSLKDMQTLPLPYPILMPEDWWAIGNNLRKYWDEYGDELYM